jgi:hypothetical protein
MNAHAACAVVPLSERSSRASTGRRSAFRSDEFSTMASQPARLPADPGLLLPDAAENRRRQGLADLFIARHVTGRTHHELRALVPAAWDLAQ